MAAAGRSPFALLNGEQFDDLMKKKDSENTQKSYEKGHNCFQGVCVREESPRGFPKLR